MSPSAPGTRRPQYDIDLDAHREPLTALLRLILAQPERLAPADFQRLVRQVPRPDGGLYSRPHLIRAYRAWAGRDGLPADDVAALDKLRRKPVRTASGVTPVTVLTRPFPCPGECIFCPNDVRMPKSYLADEPGAQRAEQNAFDPYLQAYARLTTFAALGHPTSKIEFIVLGGTWSFYPEAYQIWFIRRLFDALHDFGAGVDRRPEVLAALREQSAAHPERAVTQEVVQGALMDRTYNQLVAHLYRVEHARAAERETGTWDELEAAHRQNETAACRCVGLVVETRPDHISEAEVLRIRRLGCTKVQIGVQSLNDAVLVANRRGHDVAATRRAFRLLRRAGFKIHAHWMPNLYGSSPAEDIADYQRLFADPDFRPDELKIYPCSLIESAELMGQYQRGEWRPYTHEELLEVIVACVVATPAYCRLTRIVRDIPGTDIVDGNQVTNFRQVVDEAIRARGLPVQEIRWREVRDEMIDQGSLRRASVRYASSAGEEVFVQYVDAAGRIAAFMRLSLPDPAPPPLVDELAGAAILREVHVYGRSLAVGDRDPTRPQHSGLGAALVTCAAEMASAAGYTSLAVISAVGTRDYYRRRGFTIDGRWYQIRTLIPSPEGLPAPYGDDCGTMTA
jgi:elongator complex protein 3